MTPSPQAEETSNEQLTSLISRSMRIEDITWGGQKQGFVARYRGELLGASEALYDRLSEQLQSQNITPIFRMQDGKQVIVLLDGVIRPKPSNPWINLILFGLTVLSVLFAGALYNYSGPTVDEMGLILYLLAHLWQGWPFAVSLLSILLAHEFGHYLAARYHRAAVTLPYFIPFPLSVFGTMGAFIQLKEPPKNKNVLLDIGVAGPLAGLVVAIPVLMIGLLTSELNTLPEVLPSGQGFEGNSLLYLGIKFLIFGEWLPQPQSYGDVAPLLYWVKYFFTGLPLPAGGIDVSINQVAWAGWAGLLVTALNLIPAGQLDGGHLLFVLLGPKVKNFLPVILILVVFMGLVWSGWWLWAFLIFLIGRRHAEPLDQITPLSPRRRWVAILGLLIFILVFTPVPLVSVFN
ncbi:MAG: site-2 protease family protein [Anaerolineales bacterium]|nr:site-2 protease family protein [Anaerolineales bacterium]